MDLTPFGNLGVGKEMAPASSSCSQFNQSAHPRVCNRAAHHFSICSRNPPGLFVPGKIRDLKGFGRPGFPPSSLRLKAAS